MIKKLLAFALLGTLMLAGCAGGGGSPYVPEGDGGGYTPPVGTGFTLSGGGTQTTTQGGTVTYTASVCLPYNQGGSARANGTVHLSLLNAPAGCTVTFSANDVVPTMSCAQVQITVVTPTTIPLQSHNLTISATDGVDTRTVPATLVIETIGT